MPYELGPGPKAPPTPARGGLACYQVRQVIATREELAECRASALIKATTSAALFCSLYLLNEPVAAIAANSDGFPWWPWVVAVLPLSLMASALQGVLWLASTLRGTVDARVGVCPHCREEAHAPIPGRSYFRCSACSGGIQAKRDGMFLSSGTFIPVLPGARLECEFTDRIRGAIITAALALAIVVFVFKAMDLGRHPGAAVSAYGSGTPDAPQTHQYRDGYVAPGPDLKRVLGTDRGP